MTFADDAPEATLKNLQLLMTILRRALADSSSLSYMAMYEGIKIFFNHLMDSQASIEWREKMATSEGWREFVKGIVGLLLSISAEDDERFLPIPEKSNTERIRMERARALQAYVASGMGDAEDKQKTSAAVKLWLNNERSGPVRDVLFKLQHML